MPTLSQFYGISIKMYFWEGEHNPPHFHVFYESREAVISIKTGEVIEGWLPIRVRRLVGRWFMLHQEELQSVWDTQKFNKIKPLEEK